MYFGVTPMLDTLCGCDTRKSRHSHRTKSAPTFNLRGPWFIQGTAMVILEHRRSYQHVSSSLPHTTFFGGNITQAILPLPGLMPQVSLQGVVWASVSPASSSEAG